MTERETPVGSTFGGVMLVAGTAIGAGMLALPVATGLSGFLPSLVVYILCWAFMASTGLLFVELCHWMHKDANIITMSRITLGKAGEIACWLLYIFLFYSLILAYLVGCGDLLVLFTNGAISEWMGALLFALVMSPLLFVGPRAVSPVNIVFMVGLAITFFAFVVLGMPHVDPEKLAWHDWSATFFGLRIAFTAFAYQGTLPTLFNFMGRSVEKARRVVLIGSALPLIVYIIWQALILGIVPVFGDHGLQSALHAGESAVIPLKYHLATPIIYQIGELFAFFALVTSFFGVSLGLMDFLADGLKIEHTPRGRLLLCFVLFVPPLTIAFFSEHLFITALEYAGGIGCALLLGLMPVLMVWSGRYIMHAGGIRMLPGGRITLCVLLLFICLELATEFLR